MVKGCQCMNYNGTSDLTFKLNFTHIQFNYFFSHYHIAELVTLPSLQTQSEMTVRSPIRNVPTNCYDNDTLVPDSSHRDGSLELLTQRCGYPRYDGPTIDVTTVFIDDSSASVVHNGTQLTDEVIEGNSTLMKAEISWDQPKPVYCDVCPDPHTYYVSLYDNGINRMVPMVTYTTSASDITLSPLNSSGAYAVAVNSYVTCSGVAALAIEFNGCSIISFKLFPKAVHNTTTS